MEFDKLIADFAARHGVDGLSTEDGVVGLDIDGISVTIVSGADDLTISAEIGEPPVEEAAVFAHLLLEVNLNSEAIFAKAPDGGPYILVRRLALPFLDADAFDVALEALVNETDNWRSVLADFRPVSKTAADQAEASIPSFDSTGFMQV